MGCRGGSEKKKQFFNGFLLVLAVHAQVAGKLVKPKMSSVYLSLQS